MFKYNEKAYAEHIIENGFGTKHLNQELTIMAKYFRDKGCEDLKETLYNFCEKKMKGEFNRVTYFKNVNAAVNKALDKEEPLIIIDKISVTEEEIKRFDSFDVEYDYKKILFTMMVLEKLNKEYYHLKTGKEKNNEHFFGGTNKNYRELVESSGISFTKRNKSKYIHKVIHDLHELKILEIKNKGSVKLLYLYGINHTGKIISIKNFKKIGLYYDMYSNCNKVVSCANCCDPVLKKNNKTLYCENCAELIRKQQNRIADKKYKSKKKARK